ncbi:hypothetical protein Pmani_013163 [Petrolisthes manimaculis]|uniref:Uncharacterized protein n=1 Tax=Petrolisthes manimaculis TaxID=1843537 RepID=A0AAE1UDX1_9EUCA|nr:hypothetical protein Pmani_013163 [Petrolisthes manimaculis]
MTRSLVAPLTWWLLVLVLVVTFCSSITTTTTTAIQDARPWNDSIPVVRIPRNPNPYYEAEYIDGDAEGDYYEDVVEEYDGVSEAESRRRSNTVINVWNSIKRYFTGDTTVEDDSSAEFKNRLKERYQHLVATYTPNHNDDYPGAVVLRASTRTDYMDYGEAESESEETPEEYDYYEELVYEDGPEFERLGVSFRSTQPHGGHGGVGVLRDISGVPSSESEGAGRGIRLAQWHGRLIILFLSTHLDITLAAVQLHTLKVSWTRGLPNKGQCELHVTPDDLLLLVCVSQGAQRSDKWGAAGQGGAEGGVYLVRESALGQGPLALELVHTVATSSPSHSHMWTQEGEVWLVVTEGAVVLDSKNDTTKRVALTYHTNSQLYRWTGHYFDQAGQLPAASPRHAHHFTISRYHFLALACYTNNLGQHNIDSQVFRYEGSHRHGHYVPYQNIPTRGARHFHSFTLVLRNSHTLSSTPTSTPSVSTFLAVANFCEDRSDGGCNPHTSSAIYRYRLGKFVLFQEIRTYHALQWISVKSGRGVVVLALASSSEGVKFYEYSGWRFLLSKVQPSPESSFQPLSSGVTSLATISWSGSVLLGVSNGESKKMLGQPSIYSLSFTRDNSVQEFTTMLLKSCRDLLAKIKGQNVDDLRRKISGGRTNPGPLVFHSNVTIVGHLLVKGESKATRVYRRWRNEWFPGRSEESEPVWEAVEQEADRAISRLANTVPITGTPTWPADLSFSHLASLGTVNVSSVGELWTQRVNGREVLANPSLLIPITGRLFLPLVQFSRVVLQVSLVERLNGKTLNSFVTLSGQHTINGAITFLGQVSASQVTSLSQVVDTVQVHPNSILLTSRTHQIHAGSVTCVGPLMVEGNLIVHSFNGINISQLFPRLVLNGTSANITGKLQVVGDVVYRGNLEATISGLDTVNPLRTDVTTDQVVTGAHILGMAAWARLGMSASGRMNSINVRDQLFVNAARNTYTVSDATFNRLLTEALTVTTSLNTITVTGGELDVLKHEGNQVVSSVKTFRVISLLHEHRKPHYATPGRLRRMSRLRDELCDVEQVNSNSGAIAVLEALRSVTASEDLLSFLYTLKPGLMTLPRPQIKLLTRLLQDVPCAFTLVDPEEGYLVYDILTEWKKVGSSAMAELDLTREDLTTLTLNLQDFRRNATVRLANQRVRWQEVFTIFNDATRNIASYDVSLGILDSMKFLFGESTSWRTNRRGSNGESCRDMCGHKISDYGEHHDNDHRHDLHFTMERSSYNITGGNEVNTESEYNHNELRSSHKWTGHNEDHFKTEYNHNSGRTRCTRAASLVRGVVKRIGRYPDLLASVGQAIGRLGTQLVTSVVEHDLGRVLLLLERNQDLYNALNASIQCGVEVLEVGDQEVLALLHSYERELKRMADYTFLENDYDADSLLLSSDGSSKDLQSNTHTSSTVNKTTGVLVSGGKVVLDGNMAEGGNQFGKSIAEKNKLMEANQPDGVIDTLGTISVGNGDRKGVTGAGAGSFLLSLPRANDPISLGKTLQTSAAMEEIESFISVLQGYIGDVKSEGDLQTLVAKWDEVALAARIESIERIMLENTATVNDGVEQRLTLLHQLMDEILTRFIDLGTVTISSTTNTVTTPTTTTTTTPTTTTLVGTSDLSSTTASTPSKNVTTFTSSDTMPSTSAPPPPKLPISTPGVTSEDNSFVLKTDPTSTSEVFGNIHPRSKIENDQTTTSRINSLNERIETTTEYTENETSAEMMEAETELPKGYEEKSTGYQNLQINDTKLVTDGEPILKPRLTTEEPKSSGLVTDEEPIAPRLKTPEPKSSRLITEESIPPSMTTLEPLAHGEETGVTNLVTEQIPITPITMVEEAEVSPLIHTDETLTSRLVTAEEVYMTELNYEKEHSTSRMSSRTEPSGQSLVTEELPKTDLVTEEKPATSMLTEDESTTPLLTTEVESSTMLNNEETSASEVRSDESPTVSPTQWTKEPEWEGRAAQPRHRSGEQEAETATSGQTPDDTTAPNSNYETTPEQTSITEGITETYIENNTRASPYLENASTTSFTSSTTGSSPMENTTQEFDSGWLSRNLSDKLFNFSSKVSDLFSSGGWKQKRHAPEIYNSPQLEEPLLELPESNEESGENETDIPIWSGQSEPQDQLDISEGDSPHLESSMTASLTVIPSDDLSIGTKELPSTNTIVDVVSPALTIGKLNAPYYPKTKSSITDSRSLSLTPLEKTVEITRPILVTRINCIPCSIVVPSITTYAVPQTVLILPSTDLIETIFTSDDEVTLSESSENLQNLHYGTNPLYNGVSTASNVNDDEKVPGEEGKEWSAASQENVSEKSEMEYLQSQIKTVSTQDLARKKRSPDSRQRPYITAAHTAHETLSWSNRMFILPNKVVSLPWKSTSLVEGINDLTLYVVETCSKSQVNYETKVTDVSLTFEITPTDSVTQTTTCDTDGSRTLPSGVAEYYTTVTTQLQYFTAYIDCTSCIFVYPASYDPFKNDPSIDYSSTTPCFTTSTRYLPKPYTSKSHYTSYVTDVVASFSSVRQTPPTYIYPLYTTTKYPTSPLTLPPPLTCHDIPYKYLQLDNLLALWAKLQKAEGFLRMVAKTPDTLRIGQETENIYVSALLLEASNEMKSTVWKFLNETIDTVEELDFGKIEERAVKYLTAMSFGIKSELAFSEEVIREIVYPKILATEAKDRMVLVEDCLRKIYFEKYHQKQSTLESILTSAESSKFTLPGNRQTSTYSSLIPPEGKTTTGDSLAPKVTRGYDVSPRDLNTSTTNATTLNTKKSTTAFHFERNEDITTKYSTNAASTTHASPPLIKPRMSSPAYTTTAAATTTPRYPVHTSSYGSWVLGRISGYRLEDLAHLATPQMPGRLDALVFIIANMDRLRNLEFGGNVVVEVVNGVDVRRLARHGVLLSSTSLAAQLSFSIAVRGSVATRGQVSVRSTINGVDLVVFKRSVVLISASSVQVITTPITFTKLAAQSVNCYSCRVLGVDLEDLVLRGSDAVITGKKIFRNVNVREGVVTISNLHLHYINNINITELFHHSLRTTSDEVQVLSGEMQLTTLVVIGDLTTRGITLPTPPPAAPRIIFLHRRVSLCGPLAERVVWLNRESVITGGLVLGGQVSVDTLTFTNTFDGVASVRYDHGWLLKTTPQTINTSVTLAHLNSAHVTLQPGVRVQGVDLALLLQSSFMLSSGSVQHLSVVRFMGRVWSSRVDVQGRVQGLKLSQQAILRDASNVVFTATKSFASSVHISGTLDPNPVDLSALCGTLVEFENLKIVGNVNFLGAVTAGVVHIDEHVIHGGAGVGYWLVDRDVVLENSFTFADVQMSRLTTRTVNGVDLRRVWATCLKKECEGSQTVTGLYTVTTMTITTVLTSNIHVSMKRKTQEFIMMKDD